MNDYEFTYEDAEGRHAEVVEARNLDQAQSHFSVTHPWMARIIHVVMQRTGCEEIDGPMALAVA